MHKPKFTKKCYDCTNRFICWTSREELPEVTGLPRCSKCDSPVEIYGEPWHKKWGDVKLLCAKARCPEHKPFSGHDKGTYMEIKHDRWIKVFGWW